MTIHRYYYCYEPNKKNWWKCTAVVSASHAVQRPAGEHRPVGRDHRVRDALRL